MIEIILEDGKSIFLESIYDLLEIKAIEETDHSLSFVYALDRRIDRFKCEKKTMKVPKSMKKSQDKMMEIRILRFMAWERAKGELKSMLQTYFTHEETEDYELLKIAIDRFIENVEDNGLHE